MALPITKAQAYRAAGWMKTNFKTKIASATSGTPFSVDVICGIACQETAYFWLNFLDDLSVADVLARCVLDASGDYPGTHRSAFPKNTAAFRARYSAAFTDALIDEANKTRSLRGFGPQSWVYKGYGLFQYDLQHVNLDQAFFEGKGWYDFDKCLDKVMRELRGKYAIHHDIWKSIKAYNGSGNAATQYANNVIQFAQYASEVT